MTSDMCYFVLSGLVMLAVAARGETPANSTVPCCTVDVDVLGVRDHVLRCRVLEGNVRLVSGNRKEALSGEMFHVNGEQRICATTCGHAVQGANISCDELHAGMLPPPPGTIQPGFIFPETTHKAKACVNWLYEDSVYYAQLAFDGEIAIQYTAYEEASFRIWTPFAGIGADETFPELQKVGHGVFQYSRAKQRWLLTGGEEPAAFKNGGALTGTVCLDAHYPAVVYQLS